MEDQLIVELKKLMTDNKTSLILNKLQDAMTRASVGPQQNLIGLKRRLFHAHILDLCLAAITMETEGLQPEQITMETWRTTVQLAQLLRDFLSGLSDDFVLLLLNDAVGQLAISCDAEVGGACIGLLVLIANQLARDRHALLHTFRELVQRFQYQTEVGSALLIQRWWRRRSSHTLRHAHTRHRAACTLQRAGCQRLFLQTQNLLLQHFHSQLEPNQTFTMTNTQLDLLLEAPSLSVATATDAASFQVRCGPEAAWAQLSHDASLQAAGPPWWKRLDNRDDITSTTSPASREELKLEFDFD
ncbi:hypothetical protein NHX12_015627 [Muraenolepis orangiensis]|uniref:Uncharacterized protein n=1 Tax=Muraenolepis orangiensis TaxID=630683 RepID=A0A9Q0D8D0_9TELE|nr:hypothetical protein NHX12_015627 [Muraenolepis orangiensis]